MLLLLSLSLIAVRLGTVIYPSRLLLGLAVISHYTLLQPHHTSHPLPITSTSTHSRKKRPKRKQQAHLSTLTLILDLDRDRESLDDESEVYDTTAPEG
jgi:hypothetical protein